MKKIGLFGLTGNPTHLGHMKVIQQALLSCDEVWVSLVYIHPFGKKFIEYDLRKKMLELTLSELNMKNVYFKELDKEYFDKWNKVPYSYDLLEELNSKEKNEYKLIIGEDNYKKEVWEKFYKFREIEENFGLIIVKDLGVHSTDIRNAIKEKSNVKNEVSKSCYEFMLKNKIYEE